MHERIRDSILGHWGRLVAGRPKLTLAICIPLAVASVILTIWPKPLEVRADRSELVDPGRSWNRKYLAYKQTFPRANDVIVVIEGDPADDAINVLARTIAGVLQSDARVAAADAGFDAGEGGPHFYVAAPRETFDEVIEELAAARVIAAAPHVNAALAAMLAEFARRGASGGGDLDQLERAFEPFLEAFDDGEPDFSFLVPDRSRWQPFASHDGHGRLRYIVVQLSDIEQGVSGLGPAVKWMRQKIRTLVEQSDRPDTQWGVTGLSVIEADETSEAIHDSLLASILAMVLITLLMFIAFRGLTVPLLAAVSLLVGMSWSFGWLMLTVGHLQLLSVVFSVILLGLGIDFALLVVSRLELIQDEHDDLASATSRVFRRMGPGMVTGAVTTAAAFAAIALTDFKGMAEMGIIAAGGIILCLIAVLSVFPALLALTGRWKGIIRHRPGGETAHFARGRLDFVHNHPRRVLLIGGVVVALLLGVGSRVAYDPNVLNLQSAGVESVTWEKRIVDEDARSVWHAVVLTDREDAARLAKRLRDTGQVASIEAMGMLVPSDLDDRLAAVTAVATRPLEVPDSDRDTLADLTALLLQAAGSLEIAASGRMPGVEVGAGDAAQLRQVSERIMLGLANVQRLDTRVKEEVMIRLKASFEAAQTRLRPWLTEALKPLPPTAADLPMVLREQWIGTEGTWLLRVFPHTAEKSILHPDRLGQFVTALQTSLEGTGATVIGPTVQIYESSELIKREYIKAAVYAIAAILLLLMVDFRKLGDALCAMTPVSIGFIGAFGLMTIFDIPLNFANIIILPIIFGIGVNAGVHVVHRWRLEPHGRPRGLSGGTGRGISLTMATTMIGFGCLLVAKHRGIHSLGFVMVMGLGVTLLACYLVLPALLRLRDGPLARDADDLTPATPPD